MFAMPITLGNNYWTRLTLNYMCSLMEETFQLVPVGSAVCGVTIGTR